jgi:hypothetical protein
MWVIIIIFVYNIKKHTYIKCSHYYTN